MKTIKDVCDFIWYLENKYNLLNLEVDGVKPWQYKRMEIYYEIAQKSGVINQPHLKMSKWLQLKSLFNYVKNSIFKNPIFCKKADVLIVPNERTKEVNSKQEDIYTCYLRNELISKGANVIELERPYLGKHVKAYDQSSYFADFIILVSNLFKKAIKVTISDENREVLTTIEGEISQKIGQQFDLTNRFKGYVQRFKINYYLYSKLLIRSQVKKVYCIIGYSYGDLIAACKSLNVPVIELQHGTFSKYHLGYSYPNLQSNLDYFPDEFLVWNDYWKNLIELPINADRVKIRPFDYLKELKGHYQAKQKVSNKAVVISQGAITENIANFILTNYERFKHLDIHYKLHPGEFGRWEESPSLKKLVESNNVTLHSNSDLYELFATSEYQVGVFSTALYEGIEFNCKTWLLDLPGIEYMDRLIELHQLTLKEGIFSAN